MNSQITRCIAKGKPLAVVQSMIETEYKKLHRAEFDKALADEYNSLFPATRKITQFEYEIYANNNGDELPEFTIDEYPLIEIDYSENPDYLTLQEYTNETKTVLVGTETLEDDNGVAYESEIFEEQPIRPYTEPLQADIDALVDSEYKRLAMPKVVTMRQARLALLQSSMLDAVQAAITAGTDEAMKIEWEYATDVRRDWESLIALTESMGLTSTQLDDLFILAGTL